MNKLSFIFGAILPCAFISGWTGFSIEANWFFLWLALPMALFWIKVHSTPAHTIGAAFLLWAALAFLWGPQYWAGEAALKIAVWACAFIIGAEIEDEWVFKGLAVGIAINSCVAIAQTFGWGMSITGGTPSGLLYNSNALAEPAALVAFYFLLDGRVFWAIPSIPAILLPGTRAGLLVLAVGFLAWLWQRSRLAATALVVCFTLIGAATLASGWRVPSTEQRVEIWLDAAQGISPLGHGLGSFGRDFPRYATHLNTALERPFHAHSDLLEVTFELGIPGLGLFLAFLASSFAMAGPRERTLLAPCVALVVLDFPLYVPTTAFIIAFLAGRAASSWRERGLVGVASGHGFAAGHAIRRPVRID